LKVLVTGGSSTPGFRITQEFAKAGYKVIAQYNEHEIPEIEGVERAKIDFRDRSKLVDFINSVKPDVIIHTAALGDVDKCESDRELAWKVNADATLILIKEALKHNAYFLYLSTDYVFDGKKGLYKENEIPRPINYYGLTKFVGEEIALSHGGAVIRISAVYGTGYGRTNFGKFIVEKLSKGEKVNAAYDQYISPTLNTQIGDAVLKLAEKEFRGVVHISGPRMSRYDFSLEICKKFGFDASYISPAAIDSFNFKSPRPKDSSLDNSFGSKLTGLELSDINKSLEIFKGEYYAV